MARSRRHVAGREMSAPIECWRILAPQKTFARRQVSENAIVAGYWLRARLVESGTLMAN